jgi:uncharacterized protein YbaR (Trm112 family)
MSPTDEMAGTRERQAPDDTWVLSCPHCGKAYRIGVDAGIMTMEETLGMMAEAGATIHGSLGSGRRDDMLFPIDDVAPERLAPLQEEARATTSKIREALAKGEERAWYCRRCGSEKGTYPYPE